MAGRKSDHDVMRGVPPRRVAIGVGPACVVGLLTVLAFGAWMIPAPLLVPAVSVVAIGLALIVACAARVLDAPRRIDRLTAWDVAGALALVGFAAAMFSRPDTVVGVLNVATAAQLF